MKTAIIGSRNLTVDDFSLYLSTQTTEIVSGGAKGIDQCAKQYALEHGLKYTEFLPDYRRYRRGAPLKRNLQIIEYADQVVSFWDGHSKGTKFVIDQCNRQEIPITVV
ncbi:MAG: DNA-processing protein DprA, partial [Clostridia bacterium]|nr:DNA-processing protein DprA [Clostridia bacterium]